VHGVLLALALAGCGYGTNTRTAKDIKTIYVPFFENKTAEPNLEISVTERSSRTWSTTTRSRWCRRAGADAVLDGQIDDFKNQPFSFNQNLNAEEYHVVFTVVCTLFNRRTNEPIWKDRISWATARISSRQVENGPHVQRCGGGIDQGDHRPHPEPHRAGLVTVGRQAEDLSEALRGRARRPCEAAVLSSTARRNS
jgi:hypothetical protein